MGRERDGKQMAWNEELPPEILELKIPLNLIHVCEEATVDREDEKERKRKAVVLKVELKDGRRFDIFRRWADESVGDRLGGHNV